MQETYVRGKPEEPGPKITFYYSPDSAVRHPTPLARFHTVEVKLRQGDSYEVSRKGWWNDAGVGSKAFRTPKMGGLKRIKLGKLTLNVQENGIEVTASRPRRLWLNGRLVTDKRLLLQPGDVLSAGKNKDGSRMLHVVMGAPQPDIARKLQSIQMEPSFFKKAIIVLGAQLNEDGTPKQALQQRLDAAIKRFRELEEKGIPSVIILSGGKARYLDEKELIEAREMRKYCIEHEIRQDYLVTEEHSLDTIGNAYFVRILMEKHRELRGIRDVEIVTNTPFVRRSLGIFNHVFHKPTGFLGRGGQYYALSSTTPNGKLTVGEEDRLESYRSNEGFFTHTKPGDLKSIGNYLYTRHDLYKRPPQEKGGVRVMLKAMRRPYR